MSKTYFAAAILIFQLGRTVSAQEMSFGPCQVFGQVFGIDPLGGDMLVKSPSGDIGGLRFDQTTIFRRASLSARSTASTTIVPGEVNDGDVICARGTGNRDSVVMAGSTVLVASRAKIQEQQKANLAEWSSSGVSGLVVKLGQGSFILERILPGGPTANLVVKITSSTRFRRYPGGLADLKDATSAPTPHIHVGDRLYVRGERSADRTSINAKVVLLDGFQALTATIDSMDALAEKVTLHELSTGQLIEVRIKPSDLFLLNPGIAAAQTDIRESPQGRKLQTLDFGDLKAGDSVVVVGKLDESSGSMKGLALITDFGEVSPKPSGSQASWKLGVMKLDLP